MALLDKLPIYAPVVIVGGGPVGLACATELAFHGVGSVVVERRTGVSELRPRAKTTSARTMEHFRRWGLAGEVRRRAGLPVEWSDTAVFCTALVGREIARISGCFGLDLQGSDLVAEAGQQVPQPTVERVLRDHLTGSPLSDLVTGVEGFAAAQDGDGAWVDVRNKAGDQQRIRTGWVIGCEGARSVVRRSIGARYQGSDDSRVNFNVVFRATGLAERVPHGPAVHYWVLSATQPGVMGRLDLGSLWWAGATGMDPEAGEVDPAAIIRNLVGDDVEFELLSTDVWRARMLLADRWAEGRLLIAGDAAHQNPPWGGHGFNTGIGDAVNLGWKLAAVVKGWAPPTLLDSYQLERRPIAQQTIDEAVRNMTTLAPELAAAVKAGSDEEFAASRPAAAAAIAASKDSEFHSLGLTLGYRYDASPIISADGMPFGGAGSGYTPSAAPGGRLPHFYLEGRSVFDRLGRDFTLLGDLSLSAAGQLEKASSAQGVPLEALALDPSVCGERLGAGLVLVRPDQHVAWRGDDVTDPAAVLSRAVGRSA